MSNDTERDARLRLYAELGDSRQYIGPQEDEYGASALLRADVASLLQERDALAADYAQAIMALRGFIRWITDDGLPMRHVLEITEEVCAAEAILSTPRAQSVLAGA